MYKGSLYDQGLNTAYDIEKCKMGEKLQGLSPVWATIDVESNFQERKLMSTRESCTRYATRMIIDTWNDVEPTCIRQATRRYFLLLIQWIMMPEIELLWDYSSQTESFKGCTPWRSIALFDKDNLSICPSRVENISRRRGA